MGKKSARRAREAKQARGMASTPATDKDQSKTASRGDDFSPLQRPQISEAARGEAKEGGHEVVGEEEKAPPTRAELIEALPELRAITEAKDVDDLVDILLVPLRSGVARHAAFDECTAAEKVDECVEIAWSMIVELIKVAPDGIDIETAIPGGRGALVANKSRDYKLGFDGSLSLTALLALGDFVRGAVISAFATFVAPTEGDDFDFEVPIPRSLFVGSVVEQFRVQLEVNAVPRSEFVYRKSTVYKFKVSSESEAARIMKKGVIILGKMGSYVIKPATSRTTIEHGFVLGSTGVGSARDDLRPALAKAMACSTNAVKLFEASGVKRIWVVIEFTYPYSRERYDAVTRLFSQGQFKLVNPRVPESKPLEIFVAPTLLELGHMVGVELVKPISALAEENEDEEVEPLNLFITE